MSTFRTTLTLAVLMFAAVSLPVLGQAGGSIQDGVYSEKQAEQGEQIFTNVCSACHMDDAFTGSSYMDGWDGQSVDDMVTFIQDTMPEDNPGGLKRSEYVAVLAYILKINGVPAGDADLSTAAADLQKVTIEGPFKAGS